ncbi:hypothetical protein RU61_01823 [Salmonella enterica subsp. enterica serovar Derby]|nr:hypothetical protein [Salmonella enterica subsp. enterica serovar Derby]KMM43333.1 hypothetical protein RU61_01823 [Salmonella enterica subsp. enterica serovar Derby]
MNKLRGNFIFLILIFILFDSCIRNKHEYLVLVPLFFISDIFSVWLSKHFEKNKVLVKIASFMIFYGLMAVLVMGFIKSR